MFRAIESLCGWIWKATELVRFAVKSPLFIWATVSEASLCGLVCVSPGYFIGSAFSEALRKRPGPQGSFWFHWAMTFFAVGACMTFWLYCVYCKQYGPALEIGLSHCLQLNLTDAPCSQRTGAFQSDGRERLGCSIGGGQFGGIGNHWYIARSVGLVTPP